MGIAVSVLIGLSFLGSAVIAVPHLVVDLVGKRTPDVVFSVPVADSVIALTIDDGPSPATPAILETLRENDVRATFFLIGSHVRARPDMARRIRDAGEELGHHMMEDRPSRDLADDSFVARFDDMDRILKGLGGSRLFRPGSGWYDDRMIRVAEERGYRTVLGSVYPFDAQIPSPGFAAWYILQNTVPGSILVLHDGANRGLRTAEVLRTVLPELRRRGYRFVTVSELLDRGRRASEPTPGTKAVDGAPTTAGGLSPASASDTRRVVRSGEGAASLP